LEGVFNETRISCLIENSLKGTVACKFLVLVFFSHQTAYCQKLHSMSGFLAWSKSFLPEMYKYNIFVCQKLYSSCVTKLHKVLTSRHRMKFALRVFEKSKHSVPQNLGTAGRFDRQRIQDPKILCYCPFNSPYCIPF